MGYQLHPMGDHAVLIELGDDVSLETQQNVQMVSSLLEHNPPKWMIEYIPAYTTIAIFYDPFMASRLNQDNASPYNNVCRHLIELLSELSIEKQANHRVVEIPVCYGGDVGPDLEIVAKMNDLTTEEVIQIHSSGDYLVSMIGFAPGFPYISGMSKKIASPRRESPRLRIPAKSVGIAGKQTGIYPIETPGGWQIIGQTPLDLFRPKENPPSLLRAGDKIKFIPIASEEFKEWRKDKR